MKCNTLFTTIQLKRNKYTDATEKKETKTHKDAGVNAVKNFEIG